MMYSEYSWKIHKVNSSSYVVPDVLNLLLPYNFSIFFHVNEMLRFDHATRLLLLCKSILSLRLSTILYDSEALLFSKFLNFVLTSILIWVNCCILFLKFVLLDTVSWKFVESSSLDFQMYYWFALWLQYWWLHFNSSSLSWFKIVGSLL